MGRAEETRLFIEDSHTNNSSLQSESRRFLTETKSYIDRPSPSPLKSVFDSPQLSCSIKVQDRDSIISEKKLWIALQNMLAFQAKITERYM